MLFRLGICTPYDQRLRAGLRDDAVDIRADVGSPLSR